MAIKAKEHNLEIILTPTGIASRFGNQIVMNEDLPKYKKFCLEVFNHEIRHNNKLTVEDLAMDTTEGSILKNLEFCFKHPSGFTQFIPFGFFNKKFFMDINLLGVYLIATALIVLFFIIF